MENPRPEKVAVVAEVTEKLNNAQAVLLTEYRGMTVSQLALLRRALRPAGAEYKVYKNTLVRRAADEAGFGALNEQLVGPTAITFVNGDVAAAAKALREFGRTNPLLVIKGGLLDGRPLVAAEVTRLADLESREVLLGKLAGAMKGTLTKAAIVLNALPTKTAQLFAALQDKQGGAPSDSAEADAPVAVDAEAAPV